MGPNLTRRRMTACVDPQGTACSESALCSWCAAKPGIVRRNQSTWIAIGFGDPIPGSRKDCSDNDELMCRECGWYEKGGA